MKVLIADDSPAHLLALRKAVTGLGHDCVAAKDGDEAWERFNADRPEVVISDWVMPGIEGDELCRRIRAAKGPYCYVIVLTSLDDKQHVMRGMKAGADDYLTKPLDTDDLEARMAAAERVTALHAHIARQQSELERLNGDLDQLAREDALTKVGNRLRMKEDLERFDAQVARSGTGYTLLMCDVDHFKAYNDTCGHQRGDEVLKKVAATIGSGFRGGDAVYRYGGEEFAVVLPERTLDGGMVAAERIRQDIEALAIPHATGDDDSITISVGVAVHTPVADGSWEGTIKRADEALYRAKAGGRNRVAQATLASASTAV
jgi:two-component system cell cycle response regulator